MTHLTDEDYDTQIASATIPILVDFYMDSCGPCRAMSPIIEKLAVEYEDRVTIVKVKGSDAPNACRNLSVSSVPTLVLYKDGELVSKKTGYMNEKQLRDLIDDVA